MRWLHLSDFHFGKDQYGQISILEHILAEIRSEVGKGLGPDFVFLTGDIADKGRKDQYEGFDRFFLHPLLEILGTSHLGHVFLIPGNHDIDRTIARSVRRYDVLCEIPTFLDPTPEGRED